MRKITFLIFLIIIILSFSCSGNKKDTFVIGISQCSEDAWRRTMNEEMVREASFNPGIELKFKTAYDSNQKQIRDIESLLADGVDLLIVSPNEAVPLTPVVEKAMQAGIPVILVDRKINSGQYTAFVGADNFQVGKEVGIYSVNALRGKGRIMEIRGLSGSTPDYERHEGFMSIIKNYPDVHIVSSQDGGWLRLQAKEKTTEVLKKNIQADLVFAHNDEMATGAYEAFEVNNHYKKPVIVGIDALPGTEGGIQKVLNGIIDATFIYPTGGEKAIQTAVRILRHEPYDKDNLLYTAVVDRTNARVLKLQTDQIIEHQNRIGQLNEVLNNNLARYSTQRQFLVFSLAVIFIILILLMLLFRLYRHKNKSNIELERTNQAINRQKEELSEQRDQLITLSKNLEDATQAKLIFFTNISHEFRTPLTLLHGPLETIMKTENLSKEGNKLVHLMKKNILVLMKLIDQIIEFRQYENGKMQMYYTLGDLKLFVKEICDSFNELAKKRKLHFSFEPDSADFMVWFDSDKMEKICNNLISNAIKFTPENGHITVRLSKKNVNGETNAIVSVSDTGVGISPQHIDRIFDRFFRVDNNISGSGIGLTLTKALVEQHNGTINVESNEGSGSKFQVTIPFKQKNISFQEQYPVLDSGTLRNDEIMLLEQDDTDETSNDEKLNSDKPLILIVEDNPDVRYYVKSLLNDEFEITEAANGQKGLLKAMKYVPELIISDVMMNVMDGFEFCRQIKENITTSHIPVILLTAFAQNEQRAIGFESGADAYIPKPFDEDILKIRVRKLIENRRNIKEYFQKNLTFGERKKNVAEIDKSFIDKFRKVIEDNLTDTELNVDDIGKTLGLSRVQLYRKIKSLTNYSPNEFVRIIRLKTAEQMMINTEKSISEIAYETGFTSPSYFTKCFKEYFSESPTDFTKRIKSKK